jgi:indole-3-acetate monooxygenase
MAGSADEVIENVRALAPEIRERASETEALRRVPPDLIGKLKAAGVFRMYAPESHGGLEVDFAEGLKAIAEVARADGSAGWAVMIGSATGLIFSRLPRSTFDAIFAKGPDLIQAGLAGAPRGRAERVKGGYRVSGKWPFSSGCEHADWIIGACLVTEGGEIVPGPAEGAPLSPRIVVLPAADWTIEDTWQVSGLKGTGSHTTVLEGVFVPEEQTMELAGPPCLEGPLYAALGPWIPLMHSAFAVGLAEGAIEDLVAMAQTGRQQLFARTQMQDSPVLQYELGKIDAELKAAQALLKTVAEAHWARAKAGTLNQPDAMPQSLEAGVWITTACVEIASGCYNLGGGGALYETSPLQRRMRDMHAAAQHAVVQKQNYQAIGAGRLGVAPDHPRLRPAAK